jgi:trehalose synthase
VTGSVTILRPAGQPVPDGAVPGLDDPVLGQAAAALNGRTVWHVNSTATGGGVAELLRSGLEWHDRVGLRARWLVVSGSAEYFALTKRLHDMLHGRPGGEPLGEGERTLYDEATTDQARAALQEIQPGDIVVLHDPQPLGMAPYLRAAGAQVIWRSHIGTRHLNDEVQAAWTFLQPSLAACRKLVFSSPAYVPPFARDQAAVIYPSIDPLSDKCAELDPGAVTRVLAGIGLQDGSAGLDGSAPSPARPVARVIQDHPVPPAADVVLQVARWDRLKDVPGALTAFAQHIAPASQAELVLAGPDPDDIADDPVAQQVFDDVLQARRALSPAIRARTHLVVLSLRDQAANARIVNALQRRATVVTQKSLEEGFGLSVTEAMWKRRAVVASAVGGLTEQVTDGVHGLLVTDPRDLAGFGAAVTRLLADPPLRDRLADAGHARVAGRFLVTRELADYARLYCDLA